MGNLKFKPSFRPVRTYTHAVAGRNDEYRISPNAWRRAMRRSSKGCQASFIPNNAKPHRARQYGLKVFRYLTDAVAAHQRQSLAAREGLAPPVRRVCKFVIGERVLWGYQTALASHVGSIGNYSYRSEERLERKLVRISLVGTTDEWNGYREWCRIRSKRVRMGLDLHEGNVGFYQGKLVGIDFGTDSVEW